MTTQTPNQDQDQVRDAWNAIAAGQDEHVTPLTVLVGEEMLRRVDIGPATQLLDVATGSGAVGLVAARRGAEVLGVDIAPAMIDALSARARAEGLPNLQGLVMDGYALDLADGAFDVATSLNGVSIFPDPARGLAELVRVTRSGGRAVVGAFGALEKAEFITFFLGAIQASVPGFTPPAGPLPPFQWADPDVFDQRLTEAGLTDVSLETVSWDMHFDSAAHFWNVVTATNPIATQLAAQLALAQQEEVRQVLDGMLRERSGGEPSAVLHADINIGIGTA